MIVQYDMATGQWIEENQSAPTSRDVARLPAATPRLQTTDAARADRPATRYTLPADLLGVPVDLFLAAQAGKG